VSIWARPLPHVKLVSRAWGEEIMKEELEKVFIGGSKVSALELTEGKSEEDPKALKSIDPEVLERPREGDLLGNIN